MILRVFFFLLLVCMCTFAPFWVCALGAIAYALTYTAYELIILAVFLDAFYGMGSRFSLPLYTLVVVCGLIIIESVKPHISVYN